MNDRPRTAETPAIPVDAHIGLLWLIRLRWGAVVCQLAALAIAQSLFAMEIHTTLIGVLIAVTALSNLGLDALRRRGRATGDRIIAAVLTVDSLALTALLMASGGAANPFSVLYLVHVTLAAVLLPMSWTWLLVALSAGGFALLFAVSDATPHVHDPYGSHLQGMWIAYTAAAIVIAYFVGRLSLALRAQEQELAVVREHALRNERLAALTTLAAGAAHELSTPLSTIAVVAKEIQRKCESIEADESLREDARLVRDELDRCRAILEQMNAGAGTSVGESESEISIDRFRAMLETQLGARSDRVVVVRSGARESMIVTPHSLTRILTNLVYNALDASASDTEVTVEIRGEPERVVFLVKDCGTGMSEEVLSRAMEPFFTTKEPGRGLGLGLFLAKSFADRIGGRLALESSSAGTLATLELPHPPAADDRPALPVIEGAAEG